MHLKQILLKYLLNKSKKINSSLERTNETVFGMIDRNGGNFMKMTSEWILILDEVDQLNEMILASEQHKQLQKATNNVYSNTLLVNQINEFNQMKSQYEDVQRFGKYHPDYSLIMKSIRMQKRALDLDEDICELRIAENNFQDLLDEIGVLVGKTVSESVKVPVSNPFFASDSGCGGSCGTGGGCSCSA